VSSVSFNTGAQPYAPLVNGLVDDWLLSTRPRCNQASLQIIRITYQCLIHSILHDTPNLVIHWKIHWQHICQKLSKSAQDQQSYCKNKKGAVFFETQCTCTSHLQIYLSSFQWSTFSEHIFTGLTPFLVDSKLCQCNSDKTLHRYNNTNHSTTRSVNTDVQINSFSTHWAGRISMMDIPVSLSSFRMAWIIGDAPRHLGKMLGCTLRIPLQQKN